MAVTKYLDKTGLTYFWSKIKAWCNSLFALDSSVVHKTGDETISGLKTFTHSVFSNGYVGSIRNDPACELYFKDYTKGNSVSERMLSGMFVHDQTGAAFGSSSRLAAVLGAVNVDKSTEVILAAYSNVANSAVANSLRIVCNEDGTGYASCPTPATDDNSNKIATTAFVKAQGYVTANDKVKQVSGTGDLDRPILVRYNAVDASETANYAVYNDNVTINTSTGTLTNFGSHLMKCSGVTKGTNPSSTQYWTLTFCDKDGGNYTNNCIGMLETSLSSAGVVKTYMRAMKNAAATATPCELAVIYDTANNTGYTQAPTPATADNSTKIATTAFVKAQNYITSSSSITGTAANVTGTVAIANGGTGATSRLNAVKALTNENVGSSANYFLTITTSWGKAGYTSIADAKTVLGLGSAAYTASTAYAAASHTHSYLPLSGGTLTGSVNHVGLTYKSTTIDRADTTTDSNTEIWPYNYQDKNGLFLGNYGFERGYKSGYNRLRFRLRNTGNKWADLVFSLNDDNEYYVFLTGTTGTVNSGFHGDVTGSSSSCTGNAATATKLATARTINGVSFDGSANITITDSTKLPLTGGNLTGIVRNTGSFVTNGNFYKQHTIAVKGTDPDASCYWFYYFCDKNGLDYTNNTIGLLECRLDSNGRTNVYLRAIKNTAASSATSAELGVAYDKATDTGYAYTSIAPVASANDNKIPTTAWVRTYASSTYVDLATAQDITGVKRFTNSIYFKNTDLVKSSLPSSNAYKSIYWIDKNNDDIGRFLLYQNSSANGGAKALTIDLYTVASSPAGNSLMNMGISNVASGSSDSYIAIGSNVKFMRPSAAGTTLGTNSTDRRWGQIYSSSTTISTSDERMKDEITVVPDEVLDCWELIPWMQFKMKASIAEKGNKARLHNGIIAQTVAKAFKDFDLDASKYGLFCYDEWDEDKDQYDDNGNLIYKGTEAGNLYSIRYEEALCMEAAYQRRKNKILENRISELENQLSSVLQILQELKGVG